MNIGQRIRTLRTDGKMTLKALSSATGISVSSLSAYERGYRAPKAEAVEKIAEAFNVAPDFLTGKAKRRDGLDSIADELNVSLETFQAAFLNKKKNAKVHPVPRAGLWWSAPG